MQAYYRIGLDDLLGRDFTVQWFEGVAIVQGVCRQILASRSAQGGFPPMAEIFVCADGTIELVGTASSSEGVAAAGHTLSLMLGEDAPVRLRLVATQATAGGYPTLGEFSDAVAYFERPDPEGILRNLHHRALDLDAEPDGDVPSEFVPAAIPEQEPKPEQPPKPEPTAKPQQTVKLEQPSEQQQPAKKGRRKRLVLAGIAAGIVCAAVLGLPRGSKGPAASAVAVVQNAVRSTLARVAPAEPVKNDELKPESKVGSNAPVKRALRRLPLGKLGNDAEDRSGRRVSAVRAGAMPALLPVRPLPTGASNGPDVVDDVRPDGSEAPALYSAHNSEVVPPKSVYPKLPAAPPSGFSVPGQTVLEMVIGTNGRVERVKLRSDPRNIHEFMLVSAAKAWLFEPARLGGTPVRYLHTVVLTLQ